MWSYNYTYPNELYHHGIKGQKWGIRRYQNKDGSLTAAGRKRYSEDSNSNKSDDTKPKKKKWSKKKKVAVTAAAFVAAYATYKFVDSGHARQMIENGKIFVKNLKDRDGYSLLNFKLDNSLSSKDLSINEIKTKVVDAINPDYGKPGTTVNCRRCTVAYEMRRRGYDVKSVKTLSGTGQHEGGMANLIDKDTQYLRTRIFRKLMDNQDADMTDLTNFLSGSKRINIDTGDKDGIKNSKILFKTIMENNPNGARGELNFLWNQNYGHSMAWEIVKNKLVIFDTQTHEVYNNSEDIAKILTQVKDLHYLRLDDKDFNWDFIKRWVKNV